MKPVHVNPATGTTGLCRASKSICPFGDENHFATEAEARVSFETRQSPSASFSKASSRLPLAQVVDPALLTSMLKQGYILQRFHEDDASLSILTYSTIAQVEGKWNDATKIARGLIVQLDGSDLSKALIVERPWAKFFTLSQMDQAWHLGDEENESSAEDIFSKLDFQAPAEVYDKLDGSLGVLYRDPKGNPALATKGAFASDQAVMFTEFMRRDDAMLEAAEAILSDGETTAMFELVSPDNRIVLAYDKTDVVLLGGVKKQTGENVLPESIGAWSSKGLPVVEKMSATTLEEAVALPTRADREGLVVSVGGNSPMKIKIKQEDYKKLHRMVTMFSKKDSRAIIMELQPTYQDMLTVAETSQVEHFESVREVLNPPGFDKAGGYYEHIKNSRVGYFNEIILEKAKSIAKAKAVVDSLDEAWFTGENPAKSFASKVRALDADESSLFALFRAKLTGASLEELSATRELRSAIQDAKTKDD